MLLEPKQINGFWKHIVGSHIQPKSDGETLRLFHTDGVEYLDIKRTGAFSFFTTGGVGNRKAFFDQKSVTFAIDGSTEMFQIGDQGMGPLFEVYGNKECELKCNNTTLYGNLKFNSDSLHSIGEQTKRPLVGYFDRLNINDNGSLVDDADVGANFQLNGEDKTVFKSTVNITGRKGKSLDLNLKFTGSGVINGNGIKNTVLVDGNYNGGEITTQFNRVQDTTTSTATFDALYAFQNWVDIQYSTINMDILGTFNFVRGNANVPKGTGALYYALGSVLNYGIKAIGDTAAILAVGHILPDADSLFNIGANTSRFLKGYFDALSVGDSSGTKLEIRNDGTIQPASIADASVPNNSIYYSTTQSKLSFKDNVGVVNNLY